MKKSLLALLTSLSLLVPSLSPALAQVVPVHSTLIKGSGPAVYWYASNDRRYVFPNMKTFYSWFGPGAFAQVHQVSDPGLLIVPIGGSVPYRPGSRLLKITTDPRVYAVDASSTLRWVESEAVASAMYGYHWQEYIDDVPDAFFASYTVGRSIAVPTDFHPRMPLTPDDTLIGFRY